MTPHPNDNERNLKQEIRFINTKIKLHQIDNV
jgi:hypothetical protein